MVDSAADSAARLTLTLWPSSDSSFGGYLVVGAPVERHGGVYARHEDGVLTIHWLTSNNDTLLWRSRQSSDALGGTFNVIGEGGMSGQRGT